MIHPQLHPYNVEKHYLLFAERGHISAPSWNTNMENCLPRCYSLSLFLPEESSYPPKGTRRHMKGAGGMADEDIPWVGFEICY